MELFSLKALVVLVVAGTASARVGVRHTLRGIGLRGAVRHSWSHARPSAAS